MKISRLCLLAASLAAVLTVTGCDDKKTATPAAQASAAKTYNIGVVQLVEHQALDAANKGFVEFDFQNAQADQSNLRNIATRFTGNKVDLIGAIATPAAQTMANATNKIPIVATAVTDFEIAKLVKSNDKPGTNVTGSSDMAPISSLLELIVKIYPNAKNVGVMYSSSEINSERQVQIFKEEAKKHNLNVREATVSNVNDIQQAAQSLVGKVDLIYTPTDNTIASAVPALIKITEKAKLPVFAGEGGEVKGGATAAILEGKAKPETMPIQYQKNFKTVFNETAVKNLGLTIPADVKHELVK